MKVVATKVCYTVSHLLCKWTVLCTSHADPNWCNLSPVPGGWRNNTPLARKISCFIC